MLRPNDYYLQTVKNSQWSQNIIVKRKIKTTNYHTINSYQFVIKNKIPIQQLLRQ
jgi:hypothetical protein